MTGTARRILFVSPFNEPVSGADESLLLLLASLDRSRFEPLVIVPPDSNYRLRYEALSRVIVVEMSRMRRRYGVVFWLGFLRTLRREIRYLEDLIHRESIDLIHVNMHVCLGALLAGRRAGVPVVVHYRAKTNDHPALFFDAFLPWLHRRAARIVCISGAVADHFHKRGLCERVEVVFNPVDLGRIGEAVGVRAGPKKRVLYMGRIHPQKRIHDLLSALDTLGRRRSDVEGVIVGGAAEEAADLAYERSLKEQAAHLSLPVTFVPHTTEIASFLKEASALVLPSVHEGFGRVLVEAMAAGVPVIGARSGGIPEILGEGRFGFLFPPGDTKALADSLMQALDDPGAPAVAEEARNYAKDNFSAKAHALKMAGVYDDIKPLKSQGIS